MSDYTEIANADSDVDSPTTQNLFELLDSNPGGAANGHAPVKAQPSAIFPASNGAFVSQADAIRVAGISATDVTVVQYMITRPGSFNFYSRIKLRTDVPFNGSLDLFYSIADDGGAWALNGIGYALGEDDITPWMSLTRANLNAGDLVNIRVRSVGVVSAKIINYVGIGVANPLLAAFNVASAPYNPALANLP